MSFYYTLRTCNLQPKVPAKLQPQGCHYVQGHEKYLKELFGDSYEIVSESKVMLPVLGTCWQTQIKTSHQLNLVDVVTFNDKDETINLQINAKEIQNTPKSNVEMSDDDKTIFLDKLSNYPDLLTAIVDELENIIRSDDNPCAKTKLRGYIRFIQDAPKKKPTPIIEELSNIDDDDLDLLLNYADYHNSNGIHTAENLLAIFAPIVKLYKFEQVKKDAKNLAEIESMEHSSEYQ